MSNVRQERANSEILRALAVIVREKINDPRLKKEIITFTYSDISADFRHLKVGFSVLSGNKEIVKNILQKCEGFIKRELVSMVKMPYAPSINFIIDLGEDNSERINAILYNLEIPSAQENDDEDI